MGVHATVEVDQTLLYDSVGRPRSTPPRKFVRRGEVTVKIVQKYNTLLGDENLSHTTSCSPS